VADAEGFNAHRRLRESIRVGEDVKGRRSPQAAAGRKRDAEELGRPHRLEGQELTRRDLILVVANQDGGAHVDASLDETYARISRQNSLGRYAASEKKLAPLGSAELVSIRQVAHELLKSLKPGYRRDRRPDGSAIIGSVTFHVQQTMSGAASGAGNKSDSGRDKDTADPRGPRKR
jgi:hypothetical protein